MNGRHILLTCIGGAFALAAAGGARAQVLTCQNDAGETRFISSSRCPAGFEKTGSVGAVKKPKPAKKSSAAKPTSAASPGRLPPVSPRTQSELDKKRGAILEYELQSEEKIHGALDALIADIGEGERRTLLLKRRGEHARNIAAIRRELERLGYDANSE